MVFLIIFMLALSVVSCGWAVYQTDKARKHQEMNMAISEGAKSTRFDTSSIESMDDPGMLATIITVLVNKFGTLRLGIKDFSAIQDHEYVSVYMDTNTNELLLSLKHNLEEETGIIMDAMNFGSKDDGTFH
jgi:hypothetical protein